MSRSKQNPPNPASTRQRPQPETKHWLDKATAAFAFVAMIATGFAAYFTGRQSMIADDTEKRQLRAYIAIALKEDMAVTLNTIPSVVLEVRNVGLSPAFNIQSAGQLRVWPYPLDKPIEFGRASNHIQNMTLFPSRDVELSATGSGPFTQADAERIGSMKFRLYTIARVKYEDIWGLTDYTNFCMVSAPDAAAGLPRKPIYCEKYNDAE